MELNVDTDAFSARAPVHSAASVVTLELNDTEAFGTSALVDSAASVTSNITADARVRITGLQSKPELNGSVGTATSFVSSKGRWEVRLDSQVCVVVKPDNMVLIAPGVSKIDAVRTPVRASRGLYVSEMNLDVVGEGLPVHELAPIDIGPGGAMGALRRRDADAFLQIRRQLGREGWVALEWGEGDLEGSDGAAVGAWKHVVREGELLWPMMEPGKLITSSGSELSGVSPSGATRGDRFIVTHDERLSNATGAWCHLRSLHSRLAAFGFALGEGLQTVRFTGCSDSLFACFPGKGAKYNSHYDGGPGDARRLTAILYVNEGWRPEDGGALMLYDAGNTMRDGVVSEKCWRSVQPRAGRLVLFRSDRVLHKVAPTHRCRYALTIFFTGVDKAR